MTDMPHRGSDYSDTIEKGIAALTPADKGWIFAVVLIVLTLEAGNYMSDLNRRETHASYLAAVETNRSEEVHRAQLTIEKLTDSMVNLTQQTTNVIDRLSRAQAQIEDLTSAMQEIRDDLDALRAADDA